MAQCVKVPCVGMRRALFSSVNLPALMAPNSATVTNPSSSRTVPGARPENTFGRILENRRSAALSLAPTLGSRVGLAATSQRELKEDARRGGSRKSERHDQSSPDTPDSKTMLTITSPLPNAAALLASGEADGAETAPSEALAMQTSASPSPNPGGDPGDAGATLPGAASGPGASQADPTGRAGDATKQSSDAAEGAPRGEITPPQDSDAAHALPAPDVARAASSASTVDASHSIQAAATSAAVPPFSVPLPAASATNATNGPRAVIMGAVRSNASARPARSAPGILSPAAAMQQSPTSASFHGTDPISTFGSKPAHTPEKQIAGAADAKDSGSAQTSSGTPVLQQTSLTAAPGVAVETVASLPPGVIAPPPAPAGTADTLKKPSASGTAEASAGLMREGVPEADPTGSLSRVDVSRLLRTAAGTELRIGVRSEEFGAVTIHAALGREQISAHIATESEHLSSALSTHLSALQSALDDRLEKGSALRTSVTVTTSGESAGGQSSAQKDTATSSGGSGSSGRQSQPNTGERASEFASPRLTTTSLAGGFMVAGAQPISDRLSIRI